MILVLTQMGILILCGVLWRIIRPAGLDADVTRRVITTLVFNLLLPALVLSTLWQADLGTHSRDLVLYGVAIVLFGAGLGWALLRILNVAPVRRGAAMLGIAFGNITYMGLPLLEHLFGPSARTIVVHLDIFAGMPLVLTFGLMIARHYGQPRADEAGVLRPLLINPPLWVALIALGLNRANVGQPDAVARFLEPLADSVAPLMLIALCLGLHGAAWQRERLPLGLVVMVAKMLVVPGVGLWLGWTLGFRGDTLAAVVLEAGMPSMIFGVVYCDRYRLDASFYALIVLLTTLTATVSLPFWHDQLLTLQTPLTGNSP
ncbi:MAG: AEC family transporter [Methylococcaceae bacterium]|jgi:predicted permease